MTDHGHQSDDELDREIEELAGLDDPDEFRAAFLRSVQTRGALAAYRAARSVCENPKAPAPARATAAVALLRVAGFMEKPDDGALRREPHEMTRAELDWEIARLSRGRDGAAAPPRVKRDPGVFD